MPPGTVVVLSKQEKRDAIGSKSRSGNSGMGHTCRCYRRPLEVKVYEQTPGGVRPYLVCTPCSVKIARKYGK